MLADSAGDFTVVHGDALPLTPSSSGAQPLLYLLVSAPGASGGVASTSSGQFLSEWKLTLVSSQGEYSEKLTWDRRTDQISFDGMTFDREKGNAFVFVRDAPGKVNVAQVGPVGSGLDEAGALQEIQDALPADSAAKAVKLATSP